MPRRRKNPVILTGEDRGTLEGLIARGHAPARYLSHARILLKADEGEEAAERSLHDQAWPDVKIADALEVSRSTVSRVRERFVAEGSKDLLLTYEDSNGWGPRYFLDKATQPFADGTPDEG